METYKKWIHPLRNAWLGAAICAISLAITLVVFMLGVNFAKAFPQHPTALAGATSVTIPQYNKPDVVADIINTGNDMYVIRLHIPGREAQKVKLYQMTRKLTGFNMPGIGSNTDYRHDTWLDQYGKPTRDLAQADWFTIAELDAMDLSPKGWEIYGEPREVVVTPAVFDTIVYVATNGMDDSCRTTTNSNNATHFTSGTGLTWLNWYEKEGFRCTPAAE